MAWGLLALLSLATAQDVDVPELDAQLYHTSIDAQRTLWTDDAGKARNLTGTATLAFGYVDRPLVYVGPDDESTALVESALQANLLGGYTFGPIRVGADVPLYLMTASEVAAGGAGLGDVDFDVKGTILDHDDHPVGVALSARTSLPTSSVDAPLGASGVGWAIQGIASRKTDDWLLAANIGTRGVPAATLENVDVDDRFFYRAGVGYAITDAAGVSGDLAGELSYGEPLSNPAGAPIELLAGGWGRLSETVSLKGGLGTGLSQGIGAPVFRAVMALTIAAPESRDVDLDGILDAVDACPKEPEDVDQYRDTDGCPDRSYPLRAIARDESGAPVPTASVVVAGDAGNGTGTGEVALTLHPGTYRVNATAPGYRPGTVEVALGSTGPSEQVVVLHAITGTLRLVVKTTGNKPIPNARFRVQGDPAPRPTDETGTASVPMRVGEYEVTVMADGFRTADSTFAVTDGSVTDVLVKLAPTRVKVTLQKIEILDKVFFETAKSAIKPESFPLLDEVARVLLDNPQIAKLRVEGHTDSRGNDAYNLKLSDERAASVRAYLESKGVEAARLTSQGFGETQPVDPRNVAAAWDKNRRVEFVILEQKAE
jgi:outer membrane protein OmpA-like peptidoglycan-associated protein